MKEYILFDLDGTLVNTKEGIIKSVYYALDGLHITEDEPEKLECFIGPPLIDSFREFYQLNDRAAAEAVKLFRQRYDRKGVFECKPYDGIIEMTAKLREAGKHLGVATSKIQYSAEQILEMYKLKDAFKVIVGATLDSSLVIKADVIRTVLAEMGAFEADKVIMVGDRKHDVIGAKECGLECIGVRYGFADPGELESAGADYIVEDVEALGKLLMSL